MDQMVLDRFSGREKGTIAACCVLLAVASVLIFAGFTEQAELREHYIQLHLRKAAGRIAGEVNGDGLSSLRPGDEGSPLYLSFAKTIHQARSNETYISTAYILRVDNGTISYVVHDAYLTHGIGPYLARTGDLVTEDKEIIMAASAGQPQYSDDIYTSKWGSFLSGYAPVRDSNGTVVGILGVDETADTVVQYEFASLFNLVEVI